jgi:integrase
MASIEKRVRAGMTSYRVRYRDPGGAQRSKVFARKVDAQDWLTATEHAKRSGAYVDPAAGRARFGEWAERWWRTTAALRPTTRHDYVQKQLGHATASITLDTYGHLFPDELDQLAERLEDVRARALAARRAADVWPHGGPAVVALREGAGQ